MQVSKITECRDCRTQAPLSRTAMQCVLSATAVGLATQAGWAQPLEWRLADTGTGPTARYDGAMAYDSARGVTVMFGGTLSNGGGAASSETWEWNGSSWSLRSVAGPFQRAGHAMVYDAARGVVVMFGASAADNQVTWLWNGTAWTTVSGTTPPNRVDHAMAYDSARQVTVLFGGSAFGGGALADTWEWNGSTWTQRVAAGPSPRSYHAMAYDPVRARTVLYGGYNNGAMGGPTWEWDGSSWAQRTNSNQPDLRFRHAMSFDAGRGVTVLYGGQGCFCDQIWEWNGTTWTRRFPQVPGPGSVYGNMTAYDSARHAMVMFGTPSNVRSTWELRVPCSSQLTILQQPSANVDCDGANVPFSVAANGLYGVTYSWQIQIAPNTWLPLTNTPQPLPCGGTAQATAPNSANTLVNVTPCAGVAVYPIRVVLTNTTCSVISNVATLSVRSPDIDANGVVDSQDFFEYVCEFLGGCNPGLHADFNDDGQVTSQDLFEYLVAFFNGC